MGLCQVLSGITQVTGPREQPQPELLGGGMTSVRTGGPRALGGPAFMQSSGACVVDTVLRAEHLTQNNKSQKGRSPKTSQEQFYP